MRQETCEALKRRVALGDPEAAWRALKEAIRRRDLDALRDLGDAALPEATSTAGTTTPCRRPCSASPRAPEACSTI